MANPKSLILSVTNRCNAKCKMCEFWKEKNVIEPSLEQIDNLFSNKILQDLESISLTGGEPFLREDLPQIVDIIRKHFPDICIDIVTNGFLEDRILNLLERFQNIGLGISLDGIGKTHDLQRGIKGAYKKTIHTIQTIKRKYPNQRLAIKFTITPWNYQELTEVYNLCKKLNLYLQFKPVEIAIHYTNLQSQQKLEFSEEQIKSITNQVQEIHKDYISEEKYQDAKFIKAIPEFLTNKQLNIECKAPFESLFVMHNNDVYSCIHLDKIGNLREKNLEKIWNSKEANKIRRIVLEKKCPKCLSFHGSFDSFSEIKELKIGNLCNNNCDLCDRKLDTTPTTDEIKNKLKGIRKETDKVMFSGGEPCLRKDILELIGYAKGLDFDTIGIFSNGRIFFYEDFCKKLIQAGVNYYKIYLFSNSSKEHNKITKSPKSFKQTLIGIKNLKELKQKIEVIFLNEKSEKILTKKEISNLLNKNLNTQVLMINAPVPSVSGTEVQPIGLMYAASYLEKNDINAEIIDLTVENFKGNSLIDYIQKTSPAFVVVSGKILPSGVGISCIPFQAKSAYNIINHIKQNFPDILVILAGTYPTLTPESSLKESNADILIIGEIEETLLDIIQKETKLSEIKGIAYKKGNEIVINEPRPLIKDLDKLPFPAYDLVDLKLYKTNINGIYAWDPAVTIITTRGCPKSCSFCVVPLFYNRKVRKRSIKNVIDEIKYLIKEFGIKYFHIADEDFLIDKERVLEFCELIKKRNLNIKCSFESSPLNIIKHKDLLKKLQKCGCVHLELGLESGDQFVLNKINKRLKVEQIKEANKLIKGAGIKPFYLLMSYNMGENLDSAYKTARLVYELENSNLESEIIPPQKELKVLTEDVMLGHQAQALPGTNFYEEAKNEGVTLAKDWSDYHEDLISFIPNEMINDIPVKNNKIKDIKEYFKKFEKNIHYYTDHNFYTPPTLIQDNFANFQDYISFLEYLYNFCDGKKNVMEIYKKIKAEKPNISLQIVVSVLATMSILRLIRSKISRS